MRKLLLSLPVVIAAGFLSTSARADSQGAVSSRVPVESKQETIVSPFVNVEKKPASVIENPVKFSGSAEAYVAMGNRKSLPDSKEGKFVDDKIDYGAFASVSLAFNGSHNFFDGTNLIWSASTSFDTADGVAAFTKSFGGSEAYVGLSGNWGTVLVGYQGSIVYKAIDGFTVMDMSTLFSGYGIFSEKYMNALQYQSPEFAGFKASLQTIIDPRYTVYDTVISYSPIDDLKLNAGVSWSSGILNNKNLLNKISPKDFKSSADSDQISNNIDAKSDRDITVIFVTGEYSVKIDDKQSVGGSAGYKYAQYSKPSGGKILATSADKVQDKYKVHNMLATAFYKYDVYKIALGYEYVTQILNDFDANNKTYTPGVNGLYAEVSKNLYKNTTLYLRAGSVIFNTTSPGEGYKLDKTLYGNKISDVVYVDGESNLKYDSGFNLKLGVKASF